MTMQEFLSNINSFGADLIAKFEACKTPEEVYKVAQGVGLCASYEEFIEELKRLHDQQMKMTGADIKNIVGTVDANPEDVEMDGTFSTALVAMLAAM